VHSQNVFVVGKLGLNKVLSLNTPGKKLLIDTAVLHERKHVVSDIDHPIGIAIHELEGSPPSANDFEKFSNFTHMRITYQKNAKR
jgi:hypothetical protein